MPKLTLDMNTFKALASDTRLDILRALDGKKLNLNDMCRATNLNKATLHEHLAKLNEAGLIKKNEREGHKWVYYKLTWKGEGLLHPENTRIVVMFSTTFISLLIAIMFMVNFLQPIPVGIANTVDDTTYLYEVVDNGIPLVQRSYDFNYLGEVDAKGKTVGNITTELQGMAAPQNSLGETYPDDDIVWFEAKADYENGLRSDEILLKTTYGSNEVPSIDIDSIHFCLALKNSQNILNNSSSPIIDNTNNSINNIDYNETNESYNESDRDYNNTNDSYSKDNKLTGGFLGLYPEVPSMVAMVQDPTLLYFAVVCLTFFGALFTLSTWRLWLNRKPRL